MKRFIGCDPGSKGCLAMIAEDGTIELYELTDDNLLMNLRDWCFDECYACVEQVSSSPQMGVKSAFSFGEGYGKILMAFKCHGIPFETVPPMKWKRLFGCYLGRDATPKQKKDKDIEVCKRLYPNVALRKTARCKTDWSDAADALLLATYCKRTF